MMAVFLCFLTSHTTSKIKQSKLGFASLYTSRRYVIRVAHITTLLCSLVDL
ncbi:hypothetical protein HPTD01_913 [Halomonas sp. TD01]|nr:hypothetical protein HPTD01_913 [Halomonas sp. TD01]